AGYTRYLAALGALGARGEGFGSGGRAASRLATTGPSTEHRAPSTAGEAGTWQLAAAGCLSRLPSAVRRAAAGVAAGWPRGSGSRGASARLRRFSRFLCLSPEERYADSMSYFPPHMKERLLTPEARAGMARPTSPAGSSTFAAAFQRADGPTLLDRL